MEVRETSVLVLGGGPAGGAAALELAQAGVDAVLLERAKTPGWKIGETLPPEARVHLQRLKLWDRFTEAGHLPCHGIVSCWGSAQPAEVDHMMNPYGHAWQLDRVRFESDLLQAAREAGCSTIFDADVENIDRDQGKWAVISKAGIFRADWILDCTGREGLLAKMELAGQFRTLQDYVSLFCLLSSPQGTDADARTFVEANEHGWTYSAFMPSGKRILAFLTDRDLIPEDISPAEWMQTTVGEGSVIGDHLRKHGYGPIENPVLVDATSGRYERFSGPNWALVGDAAMTFDPLSGWGSAKAMVSAAGAVQLILNSVDYRSKCEDLWSHYFTQYRDFYIAERRWPKSPFWSRRHKVLRGLNLSNSCWPGQPC